MTLFAGCIGLANQVELKHNKKLRRHSLLKLQSSFSVTNGASASDLVESIAFLQESPRWMIVPLATLNNERSSFGQH